MKFLENGSRPQPPTSRIRSSVIQMMERHTYHCSLHVKSIYMAGDISPLVICIIERHDYKANTYIYLEIFAPLLYVLFGDIHVIVGPYVSRSAIQIWRYQSLSSTDGGDQTLNNYDCPSIQPVYVFTGVPVHIKHDITGVPKISNKLSCE